ncbi:MAG: tripartite tricarboxylate transporter TctB family protein [Pseudomonadota bacterium]
MADTLGHAADQSQASGSNKRGAIAVVLLAFAPQILEFIGSIGALFFHTSARSPITVVTDHVSALVLALPNLTKFTVSQFGPDHLASLGSSVLLALIYTYPLLAVALLTLLVKLRAPQDYFGGVVLMAIALFALWASSDLQGMKGFSFGPGTAPRMFGVLLMLLGMGVAVTGLLTEGPPLQKYGIRGPFFVTAAILSFSLTIRPLGLIISAMLSFVIAAMGTAETKWTETIIVGILLTIGCSLLFPYALGLPLELFPRVFR